MNSTIGLNNVMLRYFAHTKPYFVSLHTLHDDKTKYLAPLHTRAKSCDHEIVRAQKKVAKGRPKAPPKSCSVVMDPQVWCEAIWNWSLNQMLFQQISIHAGPHT